MRISELSRRTGIPVATVKYYLREGLLHPGTPLAATQADYDESHVERLRLVRALAELAHLPLASVRAVLQAVDADPEAGAVAVATAHDALPPAPDRSRPPQRARALLADLGWQVDPQASALYRLEAALQALEELGAPAQAEHLQAYARAALEVAEADIATVPAPGAMAPGPRSPGSTAAVDRVVHVVAGTILYEPILLALRRLAQQHVFVTASATAETAEGPRS